MVKLNKLDIEFESSQNVCYAGETIKGTVIVDLNGNIKIKGIRLRFHGYASVHWVERYNSGTGKNKRTVTKHFDAEEKYFDHSAYVFGANKAETHTLQQGVHRYPFEFFVPVGCPTTYEGSIGHVRYYVAASLEKLWVADISTLKPFTVINQLDLNLDPRAKEKSEAINEATLCCLCCKSEPISVKMSVQNLGYVPGQAIPICTKVLNLSKRKIAGMKAFLHMSVRYHTDKKTKTLQTIVASKKQDVSKSLEADALEENLTIPSVPPSFLVGCNIIDISYILEVMIQPKGPSLNLPVRMEVIIGTYPLKTGASSLIPPAISNNVNKNRIQNGSTKGEKHKITFVESVIGKVTVQDEEESENIEKKIVYSPVYPFLTVNQTADMFCVDIPS